MMLEMQHEFKTLCSYTVINSLTLGPVRSGCNNRLAQIWGVIYIILLMRTTNGGSINRRELLTEIDSTTVDFA